MADSTCSVEGCGARTVARGWCKLHYYRWYYKGDALVPGRVEHPDGCTFEGCGKRHMAHGLCGTHYARYKRNGTAALQHEPTEEERFWANVNADGVCWEWTGHRNIYGYGSFHSLGMGGPKSHKIGAHRWSWQTLVGPIPDDLQIDHRCRNRLCVLPDHLEVVTLAENVRRGAALRYGRAIA